MKIKIPTNALVIMVGAAGSGKSTLAEHLFDKDAIVSSDWCRKKVSGSEENMECSSYAFEIFYTILKARLAFGNYAVADATNLSMKAHLSLLNIKKELDIPIVFILVDTSLENCLKQNKNRRRRVPEYVIENHYKRYEEIKKELAFKSNTYLVSDDILYPMVVWEPIETEDKDFIVHDEGLDFIGDVHGCYAEFMDILRKLGYNTITFTHPQNRKFVVVGDMVDRGPSSAACVAAMHHAMQKGHYWIQGNHDNKIGRAFKGNPVSLTEEQKLTVFDLGNNTSLHGESISQILLSLPYQLRFKSQGKKIVACHAGMPIHFVGRDDKEANSHCLYGERDHNQDGIVRSYTWANTWETSDMKLIHGHDVTETINLRGPVINIDTGAVFGRTLSAYRFPEEEIVEVPSFTNADL